MARSNVKTKPKGKDQLPARRHTDELDLDEDYELEADTEAALSAIAPPKRTPLWRRFARWTFRAAFVFALAYATTTLIVPWAMHQSSHVVSRNAVVRGEIAELGTRFNGVLATIEASEGERVEAGQVLARLDDRHLQSEVAELQAAIESLEQELAVEQQAIEHERTRLGAQVEEARARAAAIAAQESAARSRAEQARAHLDRRRSLVSQGFVAREELAEAEAEYLAAMTQIDEARANTLAARSAENNVRLGAGDADLRQQRIGALEANLRAAQARLARAEANLDAALIRAPADGVVLRWQVKPGGAVRIGRPVVSMSFGEDVWIEAWIDEDRIHRVVPGSEATVSLPSYPGQQLAGVVQSIGLTTDIEQPTDAVPVPRESRMRSAPVVGVVVRLDEPPPTLLPGLSAKVSIRNGND